MPTVTTPPMKVYSQLIKEQAIAYREAYYAALDLAEAAQSKFMALSRNATTLTDISAYRANSLDARRQTELLKNQYRDFLRDQLPVTTPDEDAIRQMRAAHDRLTAAEPNNKGAAEIAEHFHIGLHLFRALHGA